MKKIKVNADLYVGENKLITTTEVTNIIEGEINKIYAVTKYITLEEIGYTNDLSNKEKINIFNSAVLSAQNSNRILLLLNNTYDFGDEKIKLDNIRIVGLCKDSTLKCSADLGDNIILENMTVYATDHWTLPYMSHSDNFLAKNVLFKANGALKGGFYLNDATATNYKFFNCDFIDGMCIALVCKCSNDMYMENFHLLRCNFTFPSHFSCIGRRKTEGVRMDRGWENLKVEHCNFIGSKTPDTDYDITFTVDAPDLDENLETDLYGVSPICKGLTVDNCKIYNGFFSFEDAGATDVLVSNCTIINNNSGYNAISQSRLENYSNLNIEYRNNYISGKCHFVGSTRLINNVFDDNRLELTYGNYMVDKCDGIGHIYQENAFINIDNSIFTETPNSDKLKKIVVFGGSNPNTTFIKNSTILYKGDLSKLFDNITDNTDIVVSNTYCSGYLANTVSTTGDLFMEKRFVLTMGQGKKVKITVPKNNVGGIETNTFDIEWVSRVNNQSLGGKFSLYLQSYDAPSVSVDGIAENQVTSEVQDNNFIITINLDTTDKSRNDVAKVQLTHKIYSNYYIKNPIKVESV